MGGVLVVVKMRLLQISCPGLSSVHVSCVTLSKSPKLLWPLFPYLENRATNTFLNVKFRNSSWAGKIK